nr:MAG TPA: hypothetical protein [Caudoviricetes sp.]
MAHVGLYRRRDRVGRSRLCAVFCALFLLFQSLKYAI